MALDLAAAPSQASYWLSWPVAKALAKAHSRGLDDILCRLGRPDYRHAPGGGPEGGRGAREAALGGISAAGTYWDTPATCHRMRLFERA